MMMTITQVVESEFFSEIIKLLDYDNEMDVFLRKQKIAVASSRIK